MGRADCIERMVLFLMVVIDGSHVDPPESERVEIAFYFGKQWYALGSPCRSCLGCLARQVDRVS
jgi:hypothetical protein